MEATVEAPFRKKGPQLVMELILAAAPFLLPARSYHPCQSSHGGKLTRPQPRVQS